jgi:NitT/TauT family transport system substrate-binding protein
MGRIRTMSHSRRNFLARVSAVGVGSFLGSMSRVEAAEPPAEVAKVRFVHAPSICVAPQYLAADLLRLEGIDIDYLPLGTRNGPTAIAEGRADVTMWDTCGLMLHLDAERPIVLLAGIHGGCYELFGNERIRAIRDLRGKNVAIQFFGGGDHVLLSSMLAYVGINPKEVNWLPGETARDGMSLFEAGKADAFLGFTPQPQELRAKKIGHVIVNTAQDRPWSQYFCCVVAANRDFVQRNPVATKRVLRAIFRAADICATEPHRAARYLSDHNYEPRYAMGLEVMQSLPYTRWREADPEDTLRFHALRLHEVGMIKSNPQKLIAQGTDWRFLNELKKELKT